MTKSEAIKRSQCSWSRRRMNAANLRLQICNLFRRGAKVSDIADASEVTSKYVYAVLKKERVAQTRVRPAHRRRRHF